MAHVLGQSHDVVRFGGLRIWAERGLVHIEDSNTNAYEVISVRDALVRMDAISDMQANTLAKKKDASKHFKALEKNQNFLDQMEVVIRKAQEQGMPHDPSAKREYARRRPTTLVMPDLPSF